jgi:hypothetical protein
MKPLINKQVISAIGCASILLTSLALSHEIIISEIKPSITNVPTVNKAITDPAITAVTDEILTPIRQQEISRNRFSRSMPTRSNTYELVEVSSDPSEGARYFDIQVTTNNIRNLFVIENNKAIKKDAQPTPEPKTHLKLKYLTESNKVLIQQDDKWVEKSEHKFLKFIPVIEK